MSGPQDPPSDDIGWRFARVVGTRHTPQCTFCNKVIHGGITRLKEHLANKSGNVIGCDKVRDDIKKEMMRHLMEKRHQKADKQKRKAEVEDHIRSTQRGMFGEEEQFEGVLLSSDESDAEMAAARRQSLKEHEFRSRVGDRYDVGGSSGASRPRGSGGSGTGQRGPSLDRRSKSVRDGRAGRYVDPNSAEARLSAMDPALHRSRDLKQQKISTKMMKGLRKKLGTAVSQFVIYGRSSFNSVLNPWLNPMLDVAREVGPHVSLPTPHEISEVYLPQEHASIKEWIASQKPTWRERGVTIMCDGWKSSATSLYLINFLVYSNKGTIFHKSVDASNVLSKTGEYYFELMDKVVEEIGEEYVVQVVTDNEAAIKLGGTKLMEKRKHLYWTPCAAHCIDLMLEDIGKKSSVKKVLADAQSITHFIYNTNGIVNFMKRYTNGRELLRPAITRFATNFLCLECIFKYKSSLQEMFNSSSWRETRWAKLNAAKEVGKLVATDRFWKKVADIMKVQEPLLKVLRLVDGDEKPTMGFIYEAMDRAKLAIQRDCRYFQEY